LPIKEIQNVEERVRVIPDWAIEMFFYCLFLVVAAISIEGYQVWIERKDIVFLVLWGLGGAILTMILGSSLWSLAKHIVQFESTSDDIPFLIKGLLLLLAVVVLFFIIIILIIGMYNLIQFIIDAQEWAWGFLIALCFGKIVELIGKGVRDSIRVYIR